MTALRLQWLMLTALKLKLVYCPKTGLRNSTQSCHFLLRWLSRQFWTLHYHTVWIQSSIIAACSLDM